MYFDSKGIDVLSELQSTDLMLSLKVIPNALSTFIGAMGSLSIGLFSVVFIAFFFMKDSRIFKNSLLAIIPKGTENRFVQSLETINDLLSRYFLGIMLQISILFVLYTIILVSFGISNAVVIAFLCALLNIIPYVGPLIGAFLMIVLSMTSNLAPGVSFQSEILPTTTYIMIFYFIAQMIDNFVSQPIIFSKTTKSHPLEIFLVIIIGGLLLGPVGMIVAVPTYTALKVILKEFLSDNKIVKSLTKDLWFLNTALLHKDVQDFINQNLSSDLTKLILKGSPFHNVSIQEIAIQIAAKKKSQKKLPSWFQTTNIYYPQSWI